LVLLEIIERKEHPGWKLVQESRKTFHESTDLKPSTLPAKMVAITVAAIAVMMTILALGNQEGRAVLISFALVLYIIVAGVYLIVRKIDREFAN
jgi:hypothetical protein